ncbi:mediator complex subunit [Imshaugia aleurites]|uniref:Mediator complex subunit n=1 Tax=Imshaugia aleurites TaxID=172621 RepID=A0A8H3ESU2_9LECA|nr:mediator complex subunit [Imshaugia aleurites]
MQSSVASLNNLNNDDLVAALQAFSTQYLHGQTQTGHPRTLFSPDAFKSHFLSELYRTIGVRVDYSIDPQLQQLLQSNQGIILQRCLSIQAALGFAGECHRPSLSAILAWTILNIRSAVMVFMGIISRKPGVENEMGKPETVHVLIGLVSWSMTLISHIVDELFVLGDFLEDNSDGAGNMSLNVLNARIHETNSPALLLLLVSSSRNFLKCNCNPLKAFMQACKSQQSHTALRLAYQELGAVFSKSLVSISQFERLLSQVENNIKSAYQASGIGETERSVVEKNMLIKAEIPEILLETVKNLLTKIAATLKEEVNVAELYFANVASLGLTDDNTSKRWRKQHPLDAMRKIELRGVQTRRCTRCAAVMEDLLPTRTASVMVSQMKHCFCGSWWMVGGEEEGNGMEY